MKKLFLDLDGTVAKFNVKNALKRFDNEKGFFAKLGAYVGIENLNELAKNGNLYIISASPNKNADLDKMVWIEKYLPNIPKNNITICRLGENKAQIIQEKYQIKINQNCLLLDDYSQNLFQWEEMGGTGVKRLTSVADNSRGLWKGLSIKNLKEIAEILAWHKKCQAFDILLTFGGTLSTLLRPMSVKKCKFTLFDIENLFDRQKILFLKLM